MKLNELEEKIGIVFPQKFHEIYQTGAMKWLEMSKEEFKEKRQCYINDEKAFLMLNCDCEMYLFDEIPEAIEDLKELIKLQEDDTGAVLSENVNLIPFGHSGGGDKYCFLYKLGSSEPEVILYYHDFYDDPEIRGRTFDEFIYNQMLDAVANDEETDGTHFKENLKFLAPEYRQLISGKSTDLLINDYDNFNLGSAEIWE